MAERRAGSGTGVQHVYIAAESGSFAKDNPCLSVIESIQWTCTNISQLPCMQSMISKLRLAINASSDFVCYYKCCAAALRYAYVKDHRKVM